MAVFFTENLGFVNPDAGECNWDLYWYKNQNLKDIINKVLLTTNRIIDGCLCSDGGGLTVNYTIGNARVNSVLYPITASARVLAGAAPEDDFITYFIYINSIGSVTESTTLPTGNFIPLCVVDVDQTSILRIHDLRPQELPSSGGGGEGGGIAWSIATSPVTAVKDNGYILNGVTSFTFPATPTEGDKVGLKDYGEQFENNPVTLNRNGSLIEGLDQDMVIDSNGFSGVFAYSDTTKGWLLIHSTPFDTIESKPFMHVQDQKPTGTNSQVGSIGDNLRELNTVLTNEIQGASLNDVTGEITLPAGIYYISAKAPTQIAGSSRLYISDGTNKLLTGSNIACNYGNSPDVFGTITLNTTTTIQVDHYCAATNAAVTLGSAISQTPYEVYTDLKIWRLDAEKTFPRVFQSVNQPIAGAELTGGIFGGELVYNTATTFDVNPVSCMDDTGLIPLARTGVTTIDLGTTEINTLYYAFVTRQTGDLYSIEFDTDINGAGLPASVNAKRWLGFVRTDSSGNILKFYMEGDYLYINDLVIYNGSVTTAYTAISVSAFLPIARLDNIQYGCIISSNTVFFISMDNINDYTSIYPITANMATAPALPVQATMYVRVGVTSTVTFYSGTMKLKR